jgi:hypothetical protein
VPTAHKDLRAMTEHRAHKVPPVPRVLVDLRVLLDLRDQQLHTSQVTCRASRELLGTTPSPGPSRRPSVRLRLSR